MSRSGQETVSVADVVKATGVSRFTLIRWAERGFIPAPTVVSRAGGRGRYGTWPRWVLDRVRKVVALQAQGSSVGSAFAQVLAAKRQLVGREVPRASFAAFVAFEKNGRTGVDLFYEHLQRVLTQSQGIAARVATRRVKFARERRALEAAIEIVNDGAEPSLVFMHQGRVAVIPDYLVPMLTNPVWAALVLSGGHGEVAALARGELASADDEERWARAARGLNVLGEAFLLVQLRPALVECCRAGVRCEIPSQRFIPAFAVDEMSSAAPAPVRYELRQFEGADGEVTLAMDPTSARHVAVGALYRQAVRAASSPLLTRGAKKGRS